MFYHKVPSYYYKVITELQIMSGDLHELDSINPPGSCLACEVTSRPGIIYTVIDFSYKQKPDLNLNLFQ